MRFAFLATIALLLAAPAASGETVRLGWHFQSEYDSLVTSLGGEQGDFFFDFGPTLEVTGETDRVEYVFEHETYYRKYAKIDQLDDFTHSTSLRGGVKLSRHVTLNVLERFSVRPQRATAASDPEEEVEPLDRLGNNQVMTNNFSATLRVEPFPRLTNTFQVSHFWRRFDVATLNSQDTSSLTTRTTSNYRITEDHTLGAGFRFRRRLFSTRAVSNSSTDTYEAFGTWTWRMDARTTFSAQVGPSWASDDLGEVEDINFPRYGTVPGFPAFLADPATCQLQSPVFGANPFPPPPTIQLGDIAILDGSCSQVAMQGPLTQQQIDDNQALSPQIGLFPTAGLDQFAETADQQDDINLFFSFGLARMLDRGRLFVTWSRSDSQTQGFGSSTVLDSLVAGGEWRLSGRTKIRTTFRYTHRDTDALTTAAFPVIFGPTVIFLPDDMGVLQDTGLTGGVIVGFINQERRFVQDDDIYSLNVNVDHDLARGLSVFLGATGRRQETSFETDITEGGSTTTQWEVQFGFNYSFRPIRL